MAVPLVLVAAAGVGVGLGLAVHRVGWPDEPAGELALAAVGPLAVLLAILGATGLLDLFVDLTSPTQVPLGLAYAILPGLLVGVVGWAVADAQPRQALGVAVLGLVLLVAGSAWAGVVPLVAPMVLVSGGLASQGGAGLVGLGLLLVAAPAPASVRDPGWTPPEGVGRAAAVAAATVLTVLVLAAGFYTVVFGGPEAAEPRWQVTVETPGPQGSAFSQAYAMGVEAPFLEGASPRGEEILSILREDVHVTTEDVGVRLAEGGRTVVVMIDSGQTVTVAADLTFWGRGEHTGAFLDHQLPTRNVTVSDAPPYAGQRNLSVTWTYEAEGGGCSVDARLQAEVPAPGNATLASDDPGDVREDGRFQAVCR